ncbi:MAG: site-specific integrase [Crocinitomicaceae bacterium]|nr:site-specific integrase [Crocinitomicaceae bacterium]
MSVKIITEDLTKGRKSLFLRVYVDKKQTTKSLKMFLVPEKTKADKEANKEKMKLAELARNNYESDLLNNRFGKTDPKKKYNNDFLEYIEEIVKHREKTGKNYDTWVSVQRHLNIYCDGKLKFQDVTLQFVEEFTAYLSLKKKLHQNSVHTYINKVKRACGDAFRKGLLETDVAHNVKPPKQVDTQREFLSKEELIAMKNTPCRSEVLKKAFLFACYTGLRWSDVHNLKWGNVTNVNGVNILDYTQQKTQNYEKLPIPEIALHFMPDTREQGKDDEDGGKVFVGLKYSAWVNCLLMKWVADAGVKKHITFHCARHSFATLLINNKVELNTVSKMLGHRDLRTTQIYAKLLEETKVEAVNVMDSIFG